MKVTDKRKDIGKRKADELFDQINSGDQKSLYPESWI